MERKDNLLGIALFFFLIAALMLMVGCQTKTTAARFEAAQSQTLTCQQRAMAMQETMAKNAPKFTDERNALMYYVVQELARSKSADTMSSCDDIYIAMLNADSKKTGKLIDGTFRIGSFALGIVGLDMIVDGITDLSDQGASEIWNVEGSRVVNRSTATNGSTISSSGEGLGIGNVFGRNTAQGGIEPRQWQTGSGTTVTDIRTESQSGENAPVQPVDGGTATQLPAE